MGREEQQPPKPAGRIEMSASARERNRRGMLLLFTGIAVGWALLLEGSLSPGVPADFTPVEYEDGIYVAGLSPMSTAVTAGDTVVSNLYLVLSEENHAGAGIHLALGKVKHYQDPRCSYAELNVSDEPVFERGRLYSIPYVLTCPTDIQYTRTGYYLSIFQVDMAPDTIPYLPVSAPSRIVYGWARFGPVTFLPVWQRP